ncbi:MAG TPA: sigma-54 dependent transcriptional regulator [Gemmatimonadales bacterium]|jgi:DNA-binding NtrC family response regulator|nr:sigma-54 dependent transcriptional regulator [Gemmatimonadales bacterium]
MRILILDPDDSFRQSLAPALEEAGYEPLLRREPEAALVEAQAGGVEALLLDLESSESGVLNLLRRYRAAGGSGIVVVTGGPATAPLAAIALREGADGFVKKPALAEEVLLTLRQAEEREGLRQEVARLRATLGARGLEPLVVAEDPKMRGLLEQAARAAASDGTVLITGERGTGKALLAQAMHRFSRRGDAAFVAVDCDTVPDLFAPPLPSPGNGYRLDDSRPLPGDPQALWRSASRGTLLLEEIVALSPESQVQLLSRLGARNSNGESPAPREGDVRVMATARAPLDTAVGEGRFRAELLQRLRGVTIALPPLRERPEDIPALITHFVQQVASRTGRPVSVSPSALAGLSAYGWPGNVRELRQVVERAATLSPSGKLDRGDFPVLLIGQSAAAGGVFALRPQVDAVEREAIVRALTAADGTRRDAARLLQVSLRTLFYKLRRHGLG